MKLRLDIDPDIVAKMAAGVAAGERAVTAAMREAGTGLKSAWRTQITGAGLGTRLANSIRLTSFPKSGESLNAAALVWSNAPVIVGAHDTGPLIRSKNGFWLTIPMPAAGKSTRGGRITPEYAQYQGCHGSDISTVRKPEYKGRAHPPRCGDCLFKDAVQGVPVHHPVWGDQNACVLGNGLGPHSKQHHVAKLCRTFNFDHAACAAIAQNLLCPYLAPIGGIGRQARRLQAHHITPDPAQKPEAIAAHAEK